MDAVEADMVEVDTMDVAAKVEAVVERETGYRIPYVHPLRPVSHMKGWSMARNCSGAVIAQNGGTI